MAVFLIKTSATLSYSTRRSPWTVVRFLEESGHVCLTVNSPFKAWVDVLQYSSILLGPKLEKGKGSQLYAVYGDCIVFSTLPEHGSHKCVFRWKFYLLSQNPFQICERSLVISNNWWKGNVKQVPIRSNRIQISHTDAMGPVALGSTFTFTLINLTAGGMVAQWLVRLPCIAGVLRLSLTMTNICMELVWVPSEYFDFLPNK